MNLSRIEIIGFLTALAIRLLLMPITFHPDLWALTFPGYFFAFEGVKNIYEHLANLPQEHPLYSGFGVKDLFIYSPFAFFTLGFFMKTLAVFHNPELIRLAMADPGSATLSSHVFTHAFLMKLPYLIFDIGSAFLLRSLFKDTKKKQLVFLLWLFNPVTIYATFMIGQIDIFQTFFVILALFFALREKKVLSLASLGLAASYKLFPLFLIPVAALVLEKRGVDRFKLLCVGFGTYFVTILPFLTTPAFRGALLESSASQKLFFAKLSLTGAESIYVFVFIYAVILLFALYHHFTPKSLWMAFLFIFLTFFSVSHYHPQWFLWVSPFLIVLITVRPIYKTLVVFLFGLYVFLTLFFESSLTWGLFTPVNHALYNAPSLTDLLPNGIDTSILKSVARSFFAAVSVYLAFRLLREKSYELS